MTSGQTKNQFEAAVEAFIQIGFPRYESLILAILSAEGTSTVKEIHQKTDIPLPKVYQTLDSLSRKDFIKHHSKTRPVKYTVYSPGILLGKIEEENRVAEESLKSKLTNLKKDSPPTFAGDIFPFTDKNELLRIGRSLIQNETNRLSVIMSTNTLTLFEDELLKAKERGVQLRSLTISQIQKATSSMKTEDYEALGFDSLYSFDLPIKLKPSLEFLRIIKNIGEFIDYLGMIIADHGETVVLLPLFPNDRYFGIWIYNNEIINRQLEIYNMFFTQG